MNYSELIDKYVPADDVFLFNTGCAQKAWLLLGCRYIDAIKMHRFAVWAPNAQSVSLVATSTAGIRRKRRWKSAAAYGIALPPGLITAICINTA